VVVSPSGVYTDLSIRLEFPCTNNQVEYESLPHGLHFLRDLGATDVDGLALKFLRRRIVRQTG
jgi:ribonuclease HI